MQAAAMNGQGGSRVHYRKRCVPVPRSQLACWRPRPWWVPYTQYSALRIYSPMPPFTPQAPARHYLFLPSRT